MNSGLISSGWKRWMTGSLGTAKKRMSGYLIGFETTGYRSGIAIVLALVTSLSTIAILSKTHAGPYLWITPALVFTAVVFALFFKKGIALVPVWLYGALLVLILFAALLFGT